MKTIQQIKINEKNIEQVDTELVTVTTIYKVIKEQFL